ncbi:MAG: hypothetical protein SVT52_03225 [Planctomycetota bacterium]|nr:hypothetical protein [Planctomycetota bacterium]
MRTDIQQSSEEVAAAGAPAKADGLRQALAELREAAVRKKVEPICSAYRAVRKAAKGMKAKMLFAMLAEAVDPQAMNLIVSAYSHRDCFMCRQGVTSCTQCEGSGEIEADRNCPACGGLGLSACAFCLGTSWADRDTIPKELRGPVLQRQWTHVQRDLEVLNKTFAGDAAEKVRSFDSQQRRSTIAWLIRLQARLADLNDVGIAAAEAGADETRLAAEVGRIDTYLDIMKATTL